MRDDETMPQEANPNPDQSLVPVWRTTEATVLPHVLAALDQAGIEYMVQDRGLTTELMGQRTTMTVGETELPLAVLVRAEDESRAREIVTTLTSPVMSGPIAEAVVATPPANPSWTPTPQPDHAGQAGAVRLVDASTGTLIGTLTEAQLAELNDHLERESVDDDDYYIDAATIEMLRGAPIDSATVELLQRALGSRAGVDVRWIRT